MPSQGPNSAGTGATTQIIATGNAWANPTNIYTSNNGYATVTGSATDDLTATNFGFSIPTGSVITGILVEVECKTSNGSLSEKFEDALLTSGGVKISLHSPAVNISSTEGYVSIGGSADLWNAAAPSVATVNSSSFGVRLTCYATGSTTFSIDHVRMTITYSAIVPSGFFQFLM